MIRIETKNENYRPGDSITGTIQWSDLNECESLEVRLIWYTSGKGDRDFQIVASDNVSSPSGAGNHKFSFVAPEYPNSFSGKLISLLWAIEVIVFPSHTAESKNVVIAPDGTEILLRDPLAGFE